MTAGAVAQGDADGPTIRAVLAEARRLRLRARHEKAADPYAKPWAPSDRLAYQLTAQLGPVGALAEISRRSAQAVVRYREDNERADRAARRHIRQRKVTEAERRQRLSSMTLGQRMDEALIALLTVSNVPAAGLEAPVSHGKPGSSDPLGKRLEARASSLRERALNLVVEIEDEVPRAKRRSAA